MKHALYITTFNHPAMLERLVSSGLLAGVDRDRWDVILFDQSDALPFQHEYQKLADAHGFERVHNVNGGASEAKRQQIEHAYATRREIMSQISEDFYLAPADNAECGWLASGRQTFFTDALRVLEADATLAFCNWTFARLENSDFWCHQLSKPATLTLHKVANVPHVKGDIVAFGWPYTARVRAMMKLMVDVRDPRHAEHLKSPDGGEWVLASKSLGKGASLLAQPVIHDRLPENRPQGRMP